MSSAILYGRTAPNLKVLPFLFAAKGSQSKELEECQIYEVDFRGNIIIL